LRLSAADNRGADGRHRVELELANSLHDAASESRVYHPAVEAGARRVGVGYRQVMTDTSTERRQHDRRTVTLVASLERLGLRPEFGEASTVDLSEGGARLVGPGTFAVGDVVRVIISSGGVAVENQALVVARQPGPDDLATINVAFRQPAEHQVPDLRRLMGDDSAS